jgi:hypothetical protein
MTPLSAQGISLQLPTGWEGRIGLRTVAPPAAPSRTTAASPALATSGPGSSALTAAARSATAGPAGEDDGVGGRLFPVTHAGNFALPPDRGDFGSGAVDVMGESGVLMALVEYGDECVGSALFDHPRPVPRVAEFAPDTLQRRIVGQLGYQRFFTEAGRAFCLYVVVGSIRFAPALLTDARRVLSHTTIGPRR